LNDVNLKYIALDAASNILVLPGAEDALQAQMT